MTLKSNLTFGPKGNFLLFPETLPPFAAQSDLGIYALDIPVNLPSLGDMYPQDHQAKWSRVKTQKRCLYVMKCDSAQAESWRQRLFRARVICRVPLKGPTFAIEAFAFPIPHMPNAADSNAQTIQRVSLTAGMKSVDARSCQDLDVLCVTRSTVEAGNFDGTFVGIIGRVTVQMRKEAQLSKKGPSSLYALFPPARCPSRLGLTNLQVPAEVKLRQTSRDLTLDFSYEVYLDTLNGRLYFLLSDCLCVAEY